jgi:hypothetical protein
MVPAAQHETAQIGQEKHVCLIRSSPVGPRNLPELVEILTNGRLSGGFYPPLLRKLIYQVLGVGPHSESFYLSDNPTLRFLSGANGKAVRVRCCDLAGKWGLSTRDSAEKNDRRANGQQVPVVASHR